MTSTFLDAFGNQRAGAAAGLQSTERLARGEKTREAVFSQIARMKINHTNGERSRDLMAGLLGVDEQKEPSTETRDETVSQRSCLYRLCAFVGTKIIQAANCIGRTAKENIPEVANVSELHAVNKELEAIKIRLQKAPSGDLELGLDEELWSAFRLDRKVWSSLKMSDDDRKAIIDLAVKRGGLKHQLFDQTVQRMEDRGNTVPTSVNGIYINSGLKGVTSIIKLAQLGCCCDSSPAPTEFPQRATPI